jgi:hypothetical protein
MSGPPYFGKYRGKVENNVDLKGQGRIQVSVPGILSGKMGWAMPCTPYAGPSVGFFAIPPRGASVWVEFEQGHPDNPIWTGCFWELGEAPVPPGPLGVVKTVLKTKKFTLEADENPALPSLNLEMAVGGIVGTASIKADMTGLTITAAGNTISMAADGVSINKTNLKIMK